ncbi:transposase [Shewanella sp. UCD-FRSSP16_17]|uniref:transposase n=1 Tax=Shewanella sp. UCD-FRSSP16_17 TaxID=1853256 RepID=UPI0007EEC3B8|nr:transposase [Shewanella sp. UCD-FRSSP16_17]OBT07011.1 transposase [Shewanella sp. UCD-FRSSP16_17]
MPRKLRISPIGVPQHIIQRGNNRQACFTSEQDFIAYAGWLKDYATKCHVEIHAWVFMTNHVHLLCTPRKADAISQMMQSLGRQYVRYFNYTYKRSGTLREGRFKSCLVQTEEYLLLLYRYIELNPVRASMVNDPAEYQWSSYQINALGKDSQLCTPHDVYLAIHQQAETRQSSYRDMFKHHLNTTLIEDIRQATNKGMAIGNDRFKEEIEKLTGNSMKPKKMGRPIKTKN